MTGPLAAGLAALRAGVGDGVRLDVVGLEPGRLDHDRWSSRARARVLVTADDPDEAARALLAAQASDAAAGFEPVPDLLWASLGRPPQAAFLAVIDIEAAVPHADGAVVRHPLEVQRVPVPAPQPGAPRRH